MGAPVESFRSRVLVPFVVMLRNKERRGCEGSEGTGQGGGRQTKVEYGRERKGDVGRKI